MAKYGRNDCRYFFKEGDSNNEGKGYTYEEVAEKLSVNPEIFGILYKKSLDPQNIKYVRLKKTYELIQKLKKDSIEEIVQSKLDLENVNIFEGSGDAPVNNSKDFTVQTFIDSLHYVDKKGERLMLAYNNEERIELRKKFLEQELSAQHGGLTQEDVENIEKEINILRDLGKNIAKDAYDFHKIILQEGRNTDINKTEDNARGTSFLGLEDIIHNKVAKLVISEVKKKNGKVSKELGDDSTPKIIKHLNLSAQLSGIDGKIHGHFDYISIKPDGAIEVYLIKASHEPEANWDPEKKRKYRHEMALLSQILSANGVDTSNISFYVIPVVFDYNDQFTEIRDIKVGNATCYSHSNAKFILFNEINNARRFIESPELSIELNGEFFTEANKTLNAIFPEIDIKAQGIEQTAEEWVDKNWKYITQAKQPEEGLVVEIDDEIFTVSSKEKGRNNKEVVDIVRKHMENISNSESGKYSARHIISKIKDGRRYGFAAIDDNYLHNALEKYYQRDPETYGENNSQYQYDWMIRENEDLARANMILFENRKTGQINLVIISPLNLYLKRKLNGRDNILGYHLSDMRALDNQGHELLRATNGNIEIMRGLAVLNEIIPSLGNVKLGEIEVFGNLGQTTHGISYPISQVLPNFIKARQILNDNDKSLNIKNNFLTVKNISPEKILISKFSDILTYYPDISPEFKKLITPIFGSGYNTSGVHSEDYDGMIHISAAMPLESLAIASTNEVKIERLQEIIELTSIILRDLKHISLNPDGLIAAMNSRDKLTKACAEILVEANITLDRLSGHIRVAQSDLSTVDRMFSRPQNMENSLIRICSKLLQDAINNTSYRLDPIISEFNVACLEYYLKKGYSKALNMIIGNQSSVFQHLYLDVDDELLFKNPFDQDAVLDSDDRKFLKKVLFIINRTRFGKKNMPFKDENDPEFEKFIKSKGALALFVPLEKASTSTKWSNPSKYFSDFRRRLDLYAHNPTMFFKEVLENLMTEEERNVVSEDMGNMLTHSSFRASDTVRGRNRMFSEQNYNMSHFETNIQNLVIDYVFKDIQAEEMNNMLIRARGILLHLKLTGIREEGEAVGGKKFAKTIEHIDKYITTSVLGKSILSESEQKIIGRITPLRKAVTMAYIAASPVAAMRDTIGGFISNTMRTLWKFRTDVDLSDVMWAYGFVLGQGIHSAMDLDILDKMNAKYLISNVNREQQLEGYKSNREGITNPSNLAYATLKKPDFLNRMVLFMAKLKHDGSKDAYSVIDGQLVYNWRMDKRFDLLANNDKSDMEAYNKQASLKLSLIHALNQETPGLNIPREIEADLPDGYTRQEIESIKALGDTIYGAYDKSTKAMYENTAIGSQFGVFSTWMNGIIDVYFGRRHESSYLFEKRLAEDENGNLLWLTEDGEITTENTGVPYLKNIPLMVQGVFNTFFDLGKYGLRDGIKGLLEVWNDPMLLMNLRRALSDFLVAALLGLLFEMVFDPAYKDHKKNDSGNNIAVNAILEILYKGTSTCFDEFKGPIPIMEYVTNNTNPAAFKWMSKSANDMWKLFSGQRSLGKTIVGSQALLRSMLDTYLMYQRDNS